MPKVFLTPLLIAGLLLSSMPNSSAAKKYEYNTYRQGQNWAKTWIAVGMQSDEKWFSPSTGKIIYSRLIAYCKNIKTPDTDYLSQLMSPNAQKGCADEIRKKFG
jgi:hypothetical protein